MVPQNWVPTSERARGAILASEAFLLILSSVPFVGISRIVNRTLLHPFPLLATIGHFAILCGRLPLLHNSCMLCRNVLLVGSRLFRFAKLLVARCCLRSCDTTCRGICRIACYGLPIASSHQESCRQVVGMRWGSISRCPSIYPRHPSSDHQNQLCRFEIFPHMGNRLVCRRLAPQIRGINSNSQLLHVVLLACDGYQSQIPVVVASIEQVN